MSELSADLEAEKQQHARAVAAKDDELAELKAVLAATRVEHEQELSRARASQRVLARNSRNFLDGKHELEKERAQLEQQARNGSQHGSLR